MGTKSVYFDTELEMFIINHAKKNHIKFSPAVRGMIYEYRKLKGNQATIETLQKSVEAYRRELFDVQRELKELKTNDRKKQ